MVKYFLTLLPVIVLLILSLVVIYMVISLFKIYLSLREPIVIHGGFIVFQLWITFFTGAIGLYLELDQTSHPLFLSNIIFLSLTYVGYGFIIQEIFRNQMPVAVNYNLLLLGVAPAFGFALLLGGQFNPIIGIMSQIVPLLSLTIFDYFIIDRTRNAVNLFETNEDKEILVLLRNIFSFSFLIHFLGICAMLAFSVIFVTNSNIDVEQIWVGPWNSFDFIYFIALIIVLISFLKIAKRLSEIASSIENIRLDKIINEIIS